MVRHWEDPTRLPPSPSLSEELPLSPSEHVPASDCRIVVRGSPSLASALLAFQGGAATAQEDSWVGESARSAA